MEKRLICPLLSITTTGLCIEENCAWWDKDNKSCVVKTMAYLSCLFYMLSRKEM